MYEKHFNLSLAPFNLNPDPRFLHVTAGVKEALATLAYAVMNRRGFALLTGDVGTGKTTLLQVFMKWLNERSAATAYIFNPRMAPDEFLDYMMAEFGIECASEAKSRRLIALNQWLLRRYEIGQPAVLIVDEAQQLSDEMLEELRLLTNLETPTQKLLQIVLSGQSELDEILARPSLRQLRQRIALRCRTLPLTVQETQEYIERRITVAGGRADRVFLPGSVPYIFNVSGGIVRLINQLCNLAMMNAFCDGAKSVTFKHLHDAAHELGLNIQHPAGGKVESMSDTEIARDSKPTVARQAE